MAVAAAGVGTLAWGAFEAGWLRRRVVRLEVRGLPPQLAGLRIVHLSDFHLGVPSPGVRAVERAVEWTRARDPDLVLVTGDLLSRPRGEPRLRRLLRRLPCCYVVLGNHDFGISRDPLARRSGPIDLSPATVLLDDTRTVELRGCLVQIAGVDPRSYGKARSRPARLARPDADLSILLCHYPRVLDRLPGGAFQLVFAGHMHAGQISLPYGAGKLRLAHLSARYTEGVYRRHGTTMHVSPGLGTTFVPFRFFARPEATELVLEPDPLPAAS